MGHYLADMMCDTCGDANCRCVKISKPDPDQNRWILDDLVPMKVFDYDKKYTRIETKWGSMMEAAWMRRHKAKLFETKQEALIHALHVTMETIADKHKEIESLKRKAKEILKAVDS